MMGAGPPLITKARVADPEPPALVAPSVTVDVLAEDTVPEITPVLLLRVKPVGNPVAVKLVGPLLATIV